MKTESNVKFIARLAITLLLITACVATALAGVNAVTKDRIAELKLGAAKEAIAIVLPGAATKVDFKDDSGMVTAAFASDAGYAIQVAPSGFGGTIDMMVGVDKDGKVLGISIISQVETAGLGAVSAAETSDGVAFRGQFVGMSGTLAVNKDGGQVEAISGATITSRAVTSGVNAAIACAANMG